MMSGLTESGLIARVGRLQIWLIQKSWLNFSICWYTLVGMERGWVGRRHLSWGNLKRYVCDILVALSWHLWCKRCGLHNRVHLGNMVCWGLLWLILWCLVQRRVLCCYYEQWLLVVHDAMSCWEVMVCVSQALYLESACIMTSISDPRPCNFNARKECCSRDNKRE